MKFEDTNMKYNLLGQRFGRLVVEDIVVDKLRGTDRHFWKCKCDCGNYKNVLTSDLKSGRVRSCGCWWKENSLLRGKCSYKDGRSKERLYKIYKGMLDRCYNTNRKRWYSYGGRGIKVCDEWKNNYCSFKNWAINNGYRDDLTIDRIDVNGDYEPSNCRWITIKEQGRNKQNTVYLTINGIAKPLVAWAEENGINEGTIRTRKKRGWSDYECIYGKE